MFLFILCVFVGGFWDIFLGIFVIRKTRLRKRVNIYKVCSYLYPVSKWCLQLPIHATLNLREEISYIILQWADDISLEIVLNA